MIYSTLLFLQGQLATTRTLVIGPEGQRPDFYTIYQETLLPTDKDLFHLTKSGDFLTKLSDSTFVYVLKSYPALKDIRFKEYFCDLIKSYGFGKPIPFEKVLQSEFKDYLDELWFQNPTCEANSKSKFAINFSLSTTTRKGSDFRQFTFAPHVDTLNETDKVLSSSPIINSRSAADSIELMKRFEAGMAPKAIRIQFEFKVPSVIENQLVSDAFKDLNALIDRERSRVDAKYDELCSSVPTFDLLAKRRTAKTMAELKTISQHDYEAIFSNVENGYFMRGQQMPDSVRNELENSSIQHSYTLTLFCRDDTGKKIALYLKL